VTTEYALLLDPSAFGQFLQEDPPEPGTDRDSVLTVDAWNKVTFFAEITF